MSFSRCLFAKSTGIVSEILGFPLTLLILSVLSVPAWSQGNLPEAVDISRSNIFETNLVAVEAMVDLGTGVAKAERSMEPSQAHSSNSRLAIELSFTLPTICRRFQHSLAW
jgi:hypothetical protein